MSDEPQDTGEYGEIFLFRLRYHGKKKYKDPSSMSVRQFGCHTAKQSRRWVRAINRAAACVWGYRGARAGLLPSTRCLKSTLF